jgi:hypothetical protein
MVTVTFRPGISLAKAAEEIVATYAAQLPCAFKWRGTRFTVEHGCKADEIVAHVTRMRRRAAAKARRSVDLPEVPTAVPAVVREAIDAYAYHYYEQDRGVGESVAKAAQRWEVARKRLVAWAKRLRKAKPAIIASTGGNP